MRILHYTYAMENPNSTNEDSLEVLMQRAQRARELVNAMDLDKIANHDPSEVAKIGSVKDALENLQNGDAVEHVEGVDDVVPVEPATSEKGRLIEIIKSIGMTEHVSRVMHQAGNDCSLQPFELIPHHEGLPEFLVTLAPKRVTGEGNFVVLLNQAAVFAASIKDPANKHHWRIARSRPYESTEELAQFLDQFIENAFD